MQPSPNHRLQPAVLTIAEVMDVLRIGRTKAYEQARLYPDTNGEAGLPCIKVGDSIRFLRHAIEDLLGEPITTTPTDLHDTDPPLTATPRRTNRRHPTTDPNPRRTTAPTRTNRRHPTTDTNPQLFTA